MHGISEDEPKEGTFELFEKGKQNSFDESKQRHDTFQNENENLTETCRTERNYYCVDPSENRYNHSKAKKEEYPWKRCSEKCLLDLKTVHKYVPEKRYRQELDKIIWSNVTQKYYGWKKIPSKNKALQVL